MAFQSVHHIRRNDADKIGMAPALDDTHKSRSDKKCI